MPQHQAIAVVRKEEPAGTTEERVAEKQIDPLKNPRTTKKMMTTPLSLQHHQVHHYHLSFLLPVVVWTTGEADQKQTTWI